MSLMCVLCTETPHKFRFGTIYNNPNSGQSRPSETVVSFEVMTHQTRSYGPNASYGDTR